MCSHRPPAEARQVVTFGFFDGSIEELEANQADGDFEERREAIGPYVEAVVANGVYEIVEWLEV